MRTHEFPTCFRSLLNALLPTLLLWSITGCGSGSGAGPMASGAPTADTARADSLRHLVDRMEAVMPATYPETDHPYVDSTIYHTTVDAFAQQFGSLVGTTFTPFTSGREEFLLSDLVACMDSIAVVPPDVRGVVVHYGFEATGRRFTAGINCVKMIYDPTAQEYTYDTVGTRFYRVITGRLVRAHLSDWNAQQGLAYRQNVRVIRTQGGSVGLLDSEDPESDVLPWEGELQYMVAQNSPVVTDNTRVVIASTAELTKDSHGACKYRHHIVMNLKNVTDLVNNTAYPGFLFRMKAADAGTPCPPRCKRFKYNDNSMLCQ